MELQRKLGGGGWSGGYAQQIKSKESWHAQGRQRRRRDEEVTYNLVILEIHAHVPQTQPDRAFSSDHKHHLLNQTQNQTTNLKQLRLASPLLSFYNYNYSYSIYCSLTKSNQP